MSRHLHVDPFGGISGNMWLGALLDLGWPEEALRSTAQFLGLSLEISRTARAGIEGCLVSTDVGDEGPVSLGAVLEGVDSCPVPDAVKSLAHQAFSHLAQAEGRVHGGHSVHFHAVGAKDALLDVLGTFSGLLFLDVQTVSSGPLPYGLGEIPSGPHGSMPNPAWASVHLLKGMAVRPSHSVFEEATPTGLAILRALNPSFGPPPAGKVLSVGAGAGDRRGERANLLRLVLMEVPRESDLETVISLETALDDLSPEALATAVRAIRRRGALDVWLSPLVMKKGRLGTALQVICRPEEESRLVQAIFDFTPTLGLRRQVISRYVLGRDLWTGPDGLARKAAGWPGRLPKVESRDKAGRISSRLHREVESLFEEGQEDGHPKGRQEVRHLDPGEPQHVRSDGHHEEAPHAGHGRNEGRTEEGRQESGTQGDGSLIDKEHDDGSQDTGPEG